MINSASGPKTVFGGLNGSLLPQNQFEKVGGEAPRFSDGFCGNRGPFRPPTLTILDSEAQFHNLKWQASPKVVRARILRKWPLAIGATCRTLSGVAPPEKQEGGLGGGTLGCLIDLPGGSEIVDFVLRFLVSPAPSLNVAVSAREAEQAYMPNVF